MNQEYIELVDEIKAFMKKYDPCGKRTKSPCINPPGCNCSGCSFLGPNYICQTRNLICAINFCGKAIEAIQQKGLKKEFQILRKKYWLFMMKLFSELAGETPDNITVGTSWATIEARPPGNKI